MHIVWLNQPREDIYYAVDATVLRARAVIQLPSTIHYNVLHTHRDWGCTVLGGRWNGTIGLSAHLTPHEAVRVLCHELIHVNQIVRGCLVGLPSGGVLWRGELYTDQGTDYDAHRQLPWEVEAYDRQNWLLSMVVGGVQNSESGQPST